MIYLYGLAASESRSVTNALKGVTGLQGPLQLAEIGDRVLIYSDHDDQEILPKRRLLLAHTKVLESVLALCTILPARFGLVAKDLQQVIELIRKNNDQITSQFAKVQGAVELGVRVSFPRNAALAATLEINAALRSEQERLRGRGPEAHFAIAAFGGKLAEVVDRRRGDAQRALIAALRPLVRDYVLRPPAEDTEVLRAEFLIDADAQEGFQAAVAHAAAGLSFAANADPAIQIIGPVPMYHFVRLNLAIDLDKEAA